MREPLVQCAAMTSNPTIRSLAGRSSARVLGLSAFIATLALCAYAGGQAKTGAPERPAAVVLNAIKAKASTGRAARPCAGMQRRTRRVRR